MPGGAGISERSGRSGRKSCAAACAPATPRARSRPQQRPRDGPLTTERPHSTADIARDTTTEPSPHERPPAHWPTPHSRRIAPQSNAGARAARLPTWNAPPPAAELNDAEEDRGGIQPAIEHDPAAAIVRSGFQLEPGQHVFAHVHG